MSVIVPAVLVSTFKELEQTLEKFSGIASHVQIDIIDESFHTHPTWPYANAEEKLSPDFSFLNYGPLHYEVDLMIQDAQESVGYWINAGATRITIHAETTYALPKIFQDLKKRYAYDREFTPNLLSVGLAINIMTEISLIEPYLEDCAYVQFMGIEKIGKQGEPFDIRVLQKIKSFYKKYPHIPIQIDGGVTLESAVELLKVGASRLVVGSALWKTGDVQGEFEKFKALTQQYGLYT
jgi:ribulose-phosphate 3-epimerase